MLLLLPVIGQGAEEEIDRQAQAPGRRRLEQVQHPVQDGQVLVGRDHVDAVRLDLHPVLDLDDRHGGGALEQLRQHALVRRVQVLDDDEGHAAALRHVLAKLLERLQPAGRGADADDGERALRSRGLWVLLAGALLVLSSASSNRRAFSWSASYHGGGGVTFVAVSNARIFRRRPSPWLSASRRIHRMAESEFLFSYHIFLMDMYRSQDRADLTTAPSVGKGMDSRTTCFQLY